MSASTVRWAWRSLLVSAFVAVIGGLVKNTTSNCNLGIIVDVLLVVGSSGFLLSSLSFLFLPK